MLNNLLCHSRYEHIGHAGVKFTRNNKSQENWNRSKWLWCNVRRPRLPHLWERLLHRGVVRRTPVNGQTWCYTRLFSNSNCNKYTHSTGSIFSFRSSTSSWKTTGSIFLHSWEKLIKQQGFSKRNCPNTCMRMNQSPNQSLSITIAMSPQFELLARLQKTR